MSDKINEVKPVHEGPKNLCLTSITEAGAIPICGAPREGSADSKARQYLPGVEIVDKNKVQEVSSLHKVPERGLHIPDLVGDLVEHNKTTKK